MPPASADLIGSLGVIPERGGSRASNARTPTPTLSAYAQRRLDDQRMIRKFPRPPGAGLKVVVSDWDYAPGPAEEGGDGVRARPPARGPNRRRSEPNRMWGAGPDPAEAGGDGFSWLCQ